MDFEEKKYSSGCLAGSAASFRFVSKKKKSLVSQLYQIGHWTGGSAGRGRFGLVLPFFLIKKKSFSFRLDWSLVNVYKVIKNAIRICPEVQLEGGILVSFKLK